MNARIHPLVAFFMAVVAVPLLAQPGNPPTTGAAADQVSQPVAGVSAASEQAEPVHVLGTIDTVGADRLSLKVEKAVEPSSESAAGLVGQTVEFLLDAATEKPAELKAGDRVDLWFKEDNGQRHAVRIVVAEAAGESQGSTEQQGSVASPNPGTPGGDPPATEPQPAANASPASEQAEPAHVLGTIENVSAGRLELKVEKAVEPSTESDAALVGKTVTFLLDAKTEKPADLKAGDRVDVWFKEDKGLRRAVRIVPASAAGESQGSADQQGSVAPPNPGTPGGGPPATEPQPAGSTAGSGSTVTTNPPAEKAPLNASAQPANHKAVTTKRHEKPVVAAPQPVAAPVLPNPATTVVTSPPALSAAQTSPAPSEPTGSVDVAQSGGMPQADTPPPAATRVQSDDPLRFIALGGAIGLVALVMLYFTLRARHLDLGIGTATVRIGSGKGGVG